MIRTLALAVVMAGLVAPVAAQKQAPIPEPGTAVELMAQAGAITRTALETRLTKGKPYTADAITDFVQVLGDGNRIVRRTTARLFRDSEGRTRREEVNEAGSSSETQSAVITDPVTGSSFILDTGTRTAFKSPAMFARVQAAAQGGALTVLEFDPTAMPPGVAIAPAAGGELKRRVETEAGHTVADGFAGLSTIPVGGGGMLTGMSADRGETQREDLGLQMIDGVPANGTRTTIVIPAGAIGNEQPITILSEQWFSPDLEMLILTRHSDPRVGETTYRLTNIARAEPDRSLFQVPPDYTVKERQPVLMRRQ